MRLSASSSSKQKVRMARSETHDTLAQGIRKERRRRGKVVFPAEEKKKAEQGY